MGDPAAFKDFTGLTLTVAFLIRGLIASPVGDR
jgi:hypothetical protein